LVPAPVDGRRIVGAVEMLDVRLGVRDEGWEEKVDEAVVAVSVEV
jgi:hypothetical protein